ncbi:MAG: SusC/RagA family TonB-linked outer membrane protein [Bacteroidales bacterium]|nr:SusC/RagA family TonB-linked outer membrane protein [Bacteroidales bacterium]
MVQKLLKKPKLIVILFFGLFCFAVSNAQIVVKGTVSSAADNTPLPGAAVIVSGTSIGVITDIDGNYEISVADTNATLQFSYVGFLPEEVKTGRQAIVNVSLVQDLLRLDEVIVTAYSEKSKTEISSAVVSLKADEINKVTVNSVADMLSGKVAGVQVQNSTGQPGSAGDIRIRGVGSVFSSQKPLVVVDGVIEGSYSPNDIESVTILKDAGATGLYGSRAASGVILITTKSGKSGKSLITAKVSHGIKRPEFGNFAVMNSEELFDYHSQVFSPTVFKSIRPRKLLNQDYNWIDNTYKQSQLTTAYLSATAGSEKSNYFLSVDYLDDNGTLITTNYKRMSVKLKVKNNLGEKLSVTSDISGQFTKDQYPHWTLSQGAFRLMPWDNPYTSGNELVYDVKKAGWYSNVPNNPYHSVQYNRYGNYGVGSSGNFAVNYVIIKGLSINSRTSLSAGFGKYEEIESPLSYEGEPVGGRIFNSINFSYSYGNTTLLKFERNFGIHSFSGLAGVEGGKYIVEAGYGGNGKGILPGQEVLGVSGSIEKATGNKAEVASFSSLAQINYDLSKKYFVTVSGRKDGSSKFSPNNKYGTFYSASASWLMSNEDFIKQFSYINYLKVRGSYGAIGNETFPDDNYYPYFPAFSAGYVYNNQTAYYPSNPGNMNLTWETSYPLNFGVDLGLFKKAEINIDYYNIHTKDLLFQDPLPLSQGFDFQWKNVGEIRNRGIEIGLNATLLNTRDLSCDFNFNISSNQNELVKLSDKPGVENIIISSSSQRQILEVGKPAFEWYMPKWKGVDTQTGKPLWEVIEYDAASGSEVARDTTSDYNSATLQPVGSPFPKFNGGFGTVVSYKGFSLNVAFSFVYGNKIYHYTRQEIDNDGANTNLNAFKLQDGMSRWEKPGDIATHPQPKIGGNSNAHEYSSRYLEDGSYLRVRNLTLGYSLPKKIVQKIKLAECTFNLSVDNLKTWTKFTGMDPDVPLYRSDIWTLPGLSSFKYPINKQYLLGIEIKF